MARYADAPARNHLPMLRLAAEARGLEIVEHGKGYIGLQSGRAVLEGRKYQASSTSVLASTICRSKNLQMQLLRRAGVPVPEGRSFGAEESASAIEYATRGLGWPVVVKPSDVHRGHGVVVGIQSEDEFRSGWEYAVSAMGERGEHKVIVEREHDGVDLRVYLVAGEAVAGTVRLPPYVRGDGRSTVEALVEEANQARLAHPRLRHLPIKLDAETDRHLARLRLRRDSIPGRLDVVTLSRCGNLSLGGINVDVTDQLPAGLVDLAASTMGVIPGLDAGGVDFLMPDIRTADGAVVLEVSARANISMHHFPVVGEPRDVAGALVDLSLSLYS